MLFAFAGTPESSLAVDYYSTLVKIPSASKCAHRIYFWEVFFMKVKKAVIPAAGLGTRMLPISKSVPKEMLAIVDKPAIQYLVE